jgi:hypothetical protein
MCNLSSHILRINCIYLTPKLSESLFIWRGGGLGKDIDKFFIGSHMRNNNINFDCMISQEMMPDVYMFGS